MENNDWKIDRREFKRLVTLTLPHWNKKEAYYICAVREYIDHRGLIKEMYLAQKRVNVARHEWNKDIITDSTDIFYPVDVKEIEDYNID